MIYFKRQEFDSPDIKESGALMDPDFLKKLDLARHKAAIPFEINSGYRTKDHNKKVGGKRNSSHLIGLAVDISYKDSRSRFIIVKSLMDVGFNRIGIGKTFIHVDDDVYKDQNVIWLY